MTDMSGVLVEDLLQVRMFLCEEGEGRTETEGKGMNEWKSVQDVIRGTFKTLHDVIKAQGVAIKSLERQLEGKVAHVELQGMLDRKANMSDVNKSVAEILHMLDAKASIRDMEQKANKAEMYQLLDSKVNTSDFMSELACKVDRDEHEKTRVHLEKNLETADTKIEYVLDEIRLFPKKKEVAELLHKKVDLAPLESALGIYGNQDALSKAIAKKADCQKLEEMERALNKSQAQLVKAVQKLNMLIELFSRMPW